MFVIENDQITRLIELPPLRPFENGKDASLQTTRLPHAELARRPDYAKAHRGLIDLYLAEKAITTAEPADLSIVRKAEIGFLFQTDEIVIDHPYIPFDAVKHFTARLMLHAVAGGTAAEEKKRDKKRKKRPIHDDYRAPRRSVRSGF